MKTIIYALALGCVVSFWSGFASAESFTVQGRITAVEDVYQTRIVETPEQTCRVVDVPIYGNVGNAPSTGDVLTGAIIGGIIGNNLKGEDGGGAAGAVLGGILGAEKSKNRQGIVGYRQEHQCSTTYVKTQHQSLAGFKIYYNVKGMNGIVNRRSGNRPTVGDNITVTVHINAR